MTWYCRVIGRDSGKCYICTVSIRSNMEACAKAVNKLKGIKIDEPFNIIVEHTCIG